MNKYITLFDIVNSTHGKVITQNQTEFAGVGTDSRQLLENTLFIALQGEAHDAHRFLDQAVEQGATALLIHKWEPEYEHLKGRVTIVLVDDTLKALQSLSTFRRNQALAKVIALTGSNGKTTTKEFLAAILKPYFNVHYNQGSFNNHWGVPLTLLGIMPEHDLVICEMGMNHPNEISELVGIARPNVVGVTMVGRAHLEGLGSIEAVSLAKEEIYSSVINPQHAVFNLDNPWTAKMLVPFKNKNPKSKIITFSEYNSDVPNENIDVQLSIKSFSVSHISIEGTILSTFGSCELEIFGAHNITNLMAAVSFALSTGLTPDQIWRSLPNCKNTWGRNQILKTQIGATVVFDGYNANPDSQKALIENIKLFTKNSSQKYIGVFGDMKELGDQSCILHEELGELVASAPFDIVWFVGPHCEFYNNGFIRKNKNNKITVFTSNEVDHDICLKINSQLKANDLMVIKGSRGMKLEKVLTELNININK